MNAAPLLAGIARHLRDLHVDAVLIGNAAAALQGAPVTTVDFDFMFRSTPVNVRKLKALATALEGTILRPYYGRGAAAGPRRARRAGEDL